MTPTHKQHLTDSQFAEYLEDPTPSVTTAAHVASCEQCRGELRLFLASVEDFSNAAFGWSKSQPVFSPGSVEQKSGFSTAVPLRWALATVLLAAIAIPLSLHEANLHSSNQPVAAAADGDIDSPAEIAQDNQLLNSVSVALAATETSPLQEYGMISGPGIVTGSEKAAQGNDFGAASHVKLRTP